MTQLAKPHAVKKAVALLWASLGAALAGTCAWLYTSDIPIHVGTILTLARPLLSFVVFSLLVHGISTCKNWARIVFTIYLAVDVLMTALSVVLDSSRFPFLVSLDVAVVVVQLYAAYLLFTRPSNDWFKPPVVAA